MRALQNIYIIKLHCQVLKPSAVIHAGQHGVPTAAAVPVMRYDDNSAAPELHAVAATAPDTSSSCAKGVRYPRPAGLTSPEPR